MRGDPGTLAAYAAEADRYAALTEAVAQDPLLTAFLDALPEGPRVLDLGCGPGHTAAAMRDRGARVDATDAAPEMVRLARELHGLDVCLAEFDELDAQAAYDGVWAYFSLLHAPKATMPDNLARIHRALRPGGLLTLGLKSGAGEARDRLGRFYAYYGVAEIDGLLAGAGFTVSGHVEGSGVGLDGTDAPWLVVSARA